MALKPLHTAMITSDCGTGKTIVLGAALEISIRSRIQAIESGELVIPEGQPIHSPTIWMCPSSVFSQTFTEMLD